MTGNRPPKKEITQFLVSPGIGLAATGLVFEVVVSVICSSFRLLPVVMPPRMVSGIVTSAHINKINTIVTKGNALVSAFVQANTLITNATPNNGTYFSQ